MTHTIEKDGIKVTIRKKVFDNFPEYAVCYLAYGDKSGLSETDIEHIDRFIKQNGLNCFNVDFDFENKGFNAHPCFGLACDCVTAIFSNVVDVHCSK